MSLCVSESIGLKSAGTRRREKLEESCVKSTDEGLGLTCIAFICASIASFFALMRSRSSFISIFSFIATCAQKAWTSNHQPFSKIHPVKPIHPRLPALSCDGQNGCTPGERNDVFPIWYILGITRSTAGSWEALAQDVSYLLSCRKRLSRCVVFRALGVLT